MESEGKRSDHGESRMSVAALGERPGSFSTRRLVRAFFYRACGAGIAGDAFAQSCQRP